MTMGHRDGGNCTCEVFCLCNSNAFHNKNNDLPLWLVFNCYPFPILGVSCSAFVHPPSCFLFCFCSSSFVFLVLLLFILPPYFPQDQNTKDKALQSMAAMSSAQIVSATAIHNKAAAMGIAGLGIPGATPLRPPYPAHVSLLAWKILRKKYCLANWFAIQKFSGHRSNNVNFPVEFCKSVIAEHECGMMWTV